MANSFYGTGRRKSSVARIRMTDGSGSITVNGISAEDYLERPYKLKC